MQSVGTPVDDRVSFTRRDLAKDRVFGKYRWRLESAGSEK
jgi:hypothetical protein